MQENLISANLGEDKSISFSGNAPTMNVFRFRFAGIYILVLLLENSAALIFADRYLMSLNGDSNVNAIRNLQMLRKMLVAKSEQLERKRNLNNAFNEAMLPTLSTEGAYLSFMLPARHGNVRQFHRLKFLRNSST